VAEYVEEINRAADNAEQLDATHDCCPQQKKQIQMLMGYANVL
jgi:hypothetical protein